MARVLPDQLHAFCVEAMRKAGMRERDTRTTADVLVTTDTWGITTHGTKSLRQYLTRVRAGGLSPLAVPEVVREGPSWAVVDGHDAIAMVSSCAGMELAVRKAAAAGVAYVGVKNSCHFGAAGYYAMIAARHDMVGLAMSNADPNMVVPGGKGKIVGNNPFAYAVPAGAERPLMLDIALSAVAAGKIHAATTLGKRTIPENWLVDADGLPTSDPDMYPLRACLVPMAGHKGYGLALLVEVLAAVLSGAGVTREVKSWMLDDPSKPTFHGAAFLAVDVGALMPIGEFKARMDRMIREVRGAPKAKGSERIYLPGEMEWERRDEALRCGMELPPDVIASLVGLAEDWGLDARWVQ